MGYLTRNPCKISTWFTWNKSKRVFSVRNFTTTQRYNPILDYTLKQTEKTILLVGDGDLSNAAHMAKHISSLRQDVKLIASVLESETDHNNTFQGSLENVHCIRSNGHTVQFEVDATRLKEHFETDSIDRIQWNFPHWKGKTNNRRNRALVKDFFASSKDVVTENGAIHLALMNHQGGMNSRTNSEWKRSWLTPIYAAENGYLLTHMLPFSPSYNLSAYKFVDRSFRMSQSAQMYIYSKKHQIVPKEIQMYSYFTLFLALPNPANMDSSTSTESNYWTNEQILEQSFIFEMIQSKLPHGIRLDIKPWRILRQLDEVGNKQMGEWKVVEYQIILYGESCNITFDMAEDLKRLIEDEVQLYTVGTRRGGWNTSQPLPSSILRARGW